MLHSASMRPGRRRPLTLYLVAGGALLLLPVMALLQYRWIGQVSDAERERRERTLRQATTQVAQDLDVELFRAFGGLQVDGEALRTDDWTGYAERADAWRAAATSPALVRDVLLVDRLGPAVAPEALGRDGPTFVVAEWPADLGRAAGAGHQRAGRLGAESAGRADSPDRPAQRGRRCRHRAGGAGAPARARARDDLHAGVRLYRHPARHGVCPRGVPAGLVERHFKPGPATSIAWRSSAAATPPVSSMRTTSTTCRTLSRVTTPKRTCSACGPIGSS